MERTNFIRIINNFIMDEKNKTFKAYIYKYN